MNSIQKYEAPSALSPITHGQVPQQVLLYNYDLPMLQELCAIAIQSKCYPGLDQALMLNLMLTAKELGISPIKAINGNFHIIKGKIVMASHMMSDMIRRAGHSIKVIERSATRCVIDGVRRDNGDTYTETFSMEDAKLAGYLSSPNWQKIPRDMLYARAMARMGRILFGDVIGNAYCPDEALEIAGIPPAQQPFLGDQSVDALRAITIKANEFVPKLKKESQPINKEEDKKEEFTEEHLFEAVIKIDESLSEISIRGFLLHLSHKRGHPIEVFVNKALSSEYELKLFVECVHKYKAKFESQPVVEVVEIEAVA
jgi:hypothetical protein